MMRVLIAFLILAPLSVSASRFPCDLEPPSRSQQDRLLWSYAPLLSANEEQRIDERLTRFARETSNQILVLIVDTLCGEEAADLAFAVGERWGIGQKDFNNGVVILIKPTGGSGTRRVFIATGYGLEGAIPDATCRRIVDLEMLPRFKQGEYAQGIDSALDVLFALAKGEYAHSQYGRAHVPWGLILTAVVLLLIFMLALRGRAKSYARTNGVDFWTALWLLNQMNQRRGGWGGGRSGGFGGGGFGGFGGGGFGGGGAGGSW